MEKGSVHRYYADSLEEVISCVGRIKKQCEEKKDFLPKALWFRGHEYTYYNLEANIFRNAQYKYNQNATYSNNHLREDYRYQHFMARNFDKTDYREPRSMIEWQEVMQHFFFKTRLMDWSESLFSALEFALEAFLIPYKNLEITEKRRKLQPSLWILRPSLLNDKVYDALLDKEGEVIMKKALSGIDCLTKKKVKKELKINKDIYFSLKDEAEQNYSNIVCLAALEDLMRSYGNGKAEALKRMEINPFFYILLRIYSDGIPVQSGTLPPLAIIHPYHSQRIRAQKGVFTISPYYIPNENDKKIEEMKIGFNPMAMEYMEKCRDCLYEIQLLNPSKIAGQMRMVGYRDSDLYPDTQKVAQDMENVDHSI